MKVPISDYTCVNLDAPVLPAYQMTIAGPVRWVVWCKNCRRWHKSYSTTQRYVNMADQLSRAVGSLYVPTILDRKLGAN